LTPFRGADGVFDDGVGTRLAVLATLDASGVVARLVLYGAVLHFPHSWQLGDIVDLIGPFEIPGDR